MNLFQNLIIQTGWFTIFKSETGKRSRSYTFATREHAINFEEEAMRFGLKPIYRIRFKLK